MTKETTKINIKVLRCGHPPPPKSMAWFGITQGPFLCKSVNLSAWTQKTRKSMDFGS